MNTDRGKKVSVRLYPDRFLDQQFLDIYDEMRMAQSNHAAGDFLRQCLFAGLSFYKLGIRPEDLTRGHALNAAEGETGNEKENTQQNNNEVRSTNDSDVNSSPDGESIVATETKQAQGGVSEASEVAEAAPLPSDNLRWAFKHVKTQGAQK